MAQHDYNIANQGFPAFRTDLNNALSAIQTTNSGTSRPTGAVAGQLWLDTTSPTTPTLKYYDGADDISLATIDHSANTVNWLDSTVSITGLSTTATGTVLTLSDSANTTTVNLIIDNQKEIRFRETTANGTNYVALKAPASVSADLTFTLPATDGTNGQVLTTNGSGVLSFSTPASGIAWQSSVKTSGFTAVAGEGYFCNTTSAGFTVTLPATPTAGQQVAVVDYAGTFDTNTLTISPNGNKIEGGTVNLALTGEREGVLLVYIDSTQGWLATSGINEGTDALSPEPYSIDFLVIAGGASGGGGYYAGGGGAGGFRTSTQSVSIGTVITVTVGDGGASASGNNTQGNNGSNSSISGSGLTSITSNGGGGGGSWGAPAPASADRLGKSGGSGGGGGGLNSTSDTVNNSGGSGNTPSTSPSQGNNGGLGGTGSTGPSNTASAGGGGGAGGVGTAGQDSPNANGAGGAGGNGTASSITGSSVTRAGGGGGTGSENTSATNGGTGGGGRGGTFGSRSPTAGDANTGSGGGGGVGDQSPASTSGAGGKGVVILSMPLAKFSGTTTGSPTASDDGTTKRLVFNGSGSYTA